MSTEPSPRIAYPVAYIDEESIKTLAMQTDLSRYTNPSSRIYIDNEKKCFNDKPLKGEGKQLVEVVYEALPELVIDLEKGVTKTDFAIYLPEHDQLLYVNAATRAFIIEASGKSVFPLVSEGRVVSEHEKIFYVVTSKFEVRVIRAEVRGVVVYIGDVLNSETSKMVSIIVGEGNVVTVSRCH
ncbi:MAG: DUF2118 domain-containing protein [Ignisphaera sp.]